MEGVQLIFFFMSFNLTLSQQAALNAPFAVEATGDSHNPFVSKDGILY